jgi:predicted metalloprotease
VWGKLADTQGNVTVTQAQVAEAQNAAAAVGDDRIEAKAGVQVNPETWTHGSAAQRRSWYTQGFQTGDLDACDTFRQLTVPGRRSRATSAGRGAPRGCHRIVAGSFHCA